MLWFYRLAFHEDLISKISNLGILEIWCNKIIPVPVHDIEPKDRSDNSMKKKLLRTEKKQMEFLPERSQAPSPSGQGRAKADVESPKI